MKSTTSFPDINPNADMLRRAEGGTGVSTLQQAAVKLRILTNGMKGVPNGVLGLDVQGLLPSANLPVLSNCNSVNLDGVLDVPINTTFVLTITDYDSYKNYVVTANAGTVSVLKDKITYTSPATIQTTSLTINGRIITLNIITARPAAPSILSPIEASQEISLNTTISSSAFIPQGDNSTHSSSDWLIATDASFSSIVFQSLDDTVNKVSIQTPSLIKNTVYFVKVRYKGSNGEYSAYSPVTSFKTKVNPAPTTEQAKLLASDGTSGDSFGWSVSMTSDGSRCVVGAYSKTGPAGSLQGATYVFTRSGTTWTQEAKLLVSDPGTYDYFGWSVSMSSDGSRFVSTAINKINYQGAAYIFTRSGTTWTQEAKITNGSSSDRYGASASISGDGTRCIIGAHNKSGPAGTQQGAAYIYIRSGTTWNQETILSQSDPVANDQFGFSVSISSDGGRCVIGASSKAGQGGANQGAAYVFVRSGTTWTQEAKLLASDPSVNDYFGYSVSMSGDSTRCVIGASSKAGQVGNYQGAAYVFVRSGTTWTQEAKLLASDPSVNDYFGYSVSMSSDGTFFAVSSRNKTGPAGNGQGAAYIFTRSGTTWTQEAKILASDGITSAYFGNSVSMSGDSTRCAVAAHYYTGAVYIFA